MHPASVHNNFLLYVNLVNIWIFFSNCRLISLGVLYTLSQAMDQTIAVGYCIFQLAPTEAALSEAGNYQGFPKGAKRI
jgi:hypothetical protein